MFSMEIINNSLLVFYDKKYTSSITTYKYNLSSYFQKNSSTNTYQIHDNYCLHRVNYIDILYIYNESRLLAIIMCDDMLNTRKH